MEKTPYKSGKTRTVPVIIAGVISAAFLLVSCGGGGYGGGGGMYGGGSMSTATTPAPMMFSLTAPTNGATGQLKMPTLTWGTSLYATDYFVYIKKDSDLSYPAPVSALAPTTSYTITTALDASAVYDWYVVATNTSGLATAATFTFETGP